MALAGNGDWAGGGVSWLGRLMRSTLYGVGSVDYASTALVAAALFGVGLFACWIPRGRSAQVDPMIACGTSEEPTKASGRRDQDEREGSGGPALSWSVSNTP